MAPKSFQNTVNKFFLLHPSWTGNKVNGRGGFSRERIPSKDARWLVGSSESGKRVRNVVGNVMSEGRARKKRRGVTTLLIEGGTTEAKC